MAVVPLASRQVELNPNSERYQSDAGASADAFGASQGQGLQRLGNSIQNAGDEMYKIVLRNQIEDNERNAKDLEVQYRDGVRQILYGDGSAENPGFYGMKGETALKAAPDTQKALKQLRANIQKQAINGKSAEMFGLTSSVLETQNMEGMSRYQVEQRDIANKATSEARKQGARDDAAVGYNDPKVIATSLATVSAETLDEAERAGLSEEATAQVLAEERSQVYASAIGAALTQQPDKALAMFNQYKNQLTADVAIKLGAQVAETSATFAAQNLADDIWNRPGLTYQQKLEAARAESSGDTENKLVTQLHTMYSEARSVIEAGRADYNWQKSLEENTYQEIQRKHQIEKWAEEDALKGAKKSALTAINSGVKLSDWQLKNPDMASNLIGTFSWDDLQKAENAYTKGQMYAPVSDNHTYNDLFKSSIENPSEFVGEDLSVAQRLMTEQENTKILARQAEVQNKIEALESNPAVVNNAITIARQYTPELKWSSTSPGDPRALKQNALEEYMTTWVANYLKENAKPPKQEEVRKAAVAAALKVQSDPLPEKWDINSEPQMKSWEGIGAQARSMSPQQKAAAVVEFDDIPPLVLDDIRATLKRQGVAETRALIEQLAGAVATGDRERAQALLGIKQ